ncbi:hypothetical protein [Geoglobus acetivorans]|uniref:Uncharacterized protein n=1 Tax=Geoglobus acetivorans TaxID=565033 RepID=A0ABZ3H4J6_GEOAI|nr:hypothetical protein [Geoglobus acetivorans]
MSLNEIIPSQSSEFVELLVSSNLNFIVFYENIYPAKAILGKVMEKSDDQITILAISNPTLRALKFNMDFLNMQEDRVRIICLNSTGMSDAHLTYRYDQLDDLTEYIKKLKGTLIVLGRGLLDVATNESSKRFMLKLTDEAPEGLRIIAFTSYNAYTKTDIAQFSGMFDVALHVKKQEDIFTFGEEIYELHVIQSVVPSIKPGTSTFKVGEEMKIMNEK